MADATVTIYVGMVERSHLCCDSCTCMLNPHQYHCNAALSGSADAPLIESEWEHVKPTIHKSTFVAGDTAAFLFVGVAHGNTKCYIL